MPSEQGNRRSQRRWLLRAVTPYLAATALLVPIAFASMDILSSVRAYVEGESLWSKGQKEAVRQLERYVESGDESAYQDYLEAIRIPLGDKQARTELERAAPDFALASEGFRAGHNHPDDIPGMMQLFRRFRRVDFMDQAISIWSRGDAQIEQIVAAGHELHELIAHATPSPDVGIPVHAMSQQRLRLARAVAQLRAANARATPLEETFSATLGDASRKLRWMLQIGILGLSFALLGFAIAKSIRTIREQESVERALRLSEERFDLAVRGSSDGIWNWSPDDDEVYLSPRALELLCHSVDAVPHSTRELVDLVHADDRDDVREAVRELLRGRATLDCEFRFLDGSGQYLWIHLRGRAFKFAGDRVMHAAGSVTDISERRRADELRRQSDRDDLHKSEQAQIALLEQIQGKMGRELHDDLGQQLTGVAFLAKALEQRMENVLPAEHDQVTWIVKLINDAIDRVRFMSRQLSPIEIDEVSLSTALARLAADINAIFGAKITLHLMADERRISSQDAGQLFRIAQESISNALRHGHATQILIRLDAWLQSSRLAVCDNGCGFPLSRTASTQAGLGMRNMAIRAKTLNGKLRLRSTPRGTTVIVRSPRRIAATPGEAVEGAQQ